MQLHRTCAASLAVVMCAALPAAGQTKRAISLDDQAKERFVRDPELSPDGKWVAYVVSTADLEKDKRNSDLWMVSWDGTQQVQLTSSPENESSPTPSEITPLVKRTNSRTVGRDASRASPSSDAAPTRLAAGRPHAHRETTPGADRHRPQWA